MRVKPSVICLIIIISITCIVQQARGQYAEKDFVRYSIKDGMSDNTINCVTQDEWGYIWIAAQSGLSRFDGTTFKKFLKGNEPINLPSDVITKLKIFGPHELGIFSRGGFQILNTSTYKMSDYIIPDSTAFSTPLNAVWDAIKLPDGSYAVTSAAGFYVLNGKKLIFRHDAFNINDIGRKQILFGRDIFKIKNDKYIVYINEENQAIYDNKAKTFTPISNEEMPWSPYMHPKRYPGDRWLIKRQLNDHEFIFIRVKADSIIYYNSEKNKRVATALPASFTNQLSWESKFEWIQDTVLLLNGGFNGFFRMHFDRQTGKITANEMKFLPNYQIQSLFSDKDGRLWIATSQGLLKQELVPPHITSYFYQPSVTAVSGNFFTSVFRYKKYLYAGQYSRDHGLSIIDAATMKRIKEVQFFGMDLPWNEVMTIEMYHPDTLWIGTWGGVLWYDTKTDHYGKVFDEKKYPWAADFHALLTPARDGYAWFSSYLSGKVVRYHLPSRTATLFTSLTIPTLPFEKVKGIVCDAYGDVWIAGHALTRWNTREQRFDTLIKVYGGTNKFNDDIVTISADDRGSLWMHNGDNGLLEYKIREKKFASYSNKEGLSSEFAAFSRVIGNKLWMISNYQLFCMDISTKQYTVYDYNDGLPERSSSTRRIYFDAIDSQMYLCAENYLAKFPFNSEQKQDASGELRIEDITVNNNIVYYSPGDKILFDHHENNLALHFTIVDYNRGNYQFFYRLNNSSTWNPIGTQHNISFNNLAPGEYLVELFASGKPGVTKTKSILIIIKPPFWARTWFIISSGMLVLVLIIWLFSARLRRVRQRANLDKQLSKTEMKALQAQMNPHFIFNSLNSIREMVLSEENKEASHYLSKFAQLIRITLEQSTQETVSLRATIDYLHRYIEMETIRNGFLTYEINVDDELDQDETLVSPMFIQPFVENAIWHGVSATRKDIRVKISFRKTGDLLICTVDDNGMGIQHSQSLKRSKGIHRRSLGIANVQDRIKLLNEKYHLHCSVTIIDKKERPGLNETGTLVTIQLPYQTTES